MTPVVERAERVDTLVSCHDIGPADGLGPPVHPAFTAVGSNRGVGRYRLLAALGIGATASVFGIRLLLTRQAAIARRRIGKPLGEESLDADRVWRRAFEGEPIELLLLGDSLAAGLGAERRKQTLGGRLAKGLAARMHRPVRLRTVAVVGAESPDLASQLDAVPEGYRPHVAVIVVGGNDVTHRIPTSVSAQHLDDAIRRLRAQGAEVVVGTCPDLGALRAVPQPLRRLAASMSRRLAEVQAETAAQAGAEAVDLRRAVGPMFLDEPEEMFSLDRFHPSALGYRRTAEALLPVLCRSVERLTPPVRR
nr:SGNH/GDSL hydrolase family protein [Microbacterium sp. OVT16B]